MIEQPEFAKEYTKNEKIRIVAIGIIGGSISVLFGKLLFFPWLNEFSSSVPCREIFGFKGTTLLWYLVFVGIPLSAGLLVGVTMGYQGIKILRDKQFPPIGQKVTRPTLIKRGKQAKWIGWLHLLAFSPFLAISIWGSFQASAMVKKTSVSRTHCEPKAISNQSKL